MVDIYITVENSSLDILKWEERVTESNYIKLLNVRQYQYMGKRTFFKHFITPLFVPLNTRTWVSFRNDFFLPTTTRHASKVKNDTVKVIAIFFSIILDIVTIPFRLLSAIPTVIRDNILEWRTKNLLKSFGAPQELFENNKWICTGKPNKHRTSLTG